MKFFTNNRRILTRLSSLFFLQLLLIFAFVLFGAFVSNSNDGTEPWASGNVKFITKDSRSASHTSKAQQDYTTPTFMKIIKSDNFHNQFIALYEEVAISSDIEEKIRIVRVCFKEGALLNESHRASQDVNNKTEDYADSPACVCRPEWHGHACSEPEIVWRAFMVSRQPMNQSPKFTRHPHNIFYIINGVTSINLETLEVQLMELSKIVNLFVLCDLIKADDPSLLMRHQMNKGFMPQYKDQILLLKDETCSSSNIYRQMKKILGTQMRPSDVLINGHCDEILNHRAINYMKWHNLWHQPLRFRLKWNVYGFFFQHPDNTIISSVACQLNVIEQFYKSDPDKILSNSQSPTVVTVGDLNHYGGWFCEYCHQPIDIIRKLHLDSKYLTNKSSDPLKESYHRKPVINIEYIQNLIQYGNYIDGKLELRKLRHYDDTKYFTPESVAKNRWKFDNIISNFYSSWDDGLDGDY
jgi:beta-1,4-mannosyl-glycoprotein beta-1,4-N-acetylglucosaminyltransferase